MRNKANYHVGFLKKKYFYSNYSCLCEFYKFHIDNCQNDSQIDFQAGNFGFNDSPKNFAKEQMRLQVSVFKQKKPEYFKISDKCEKLIKKFVSLNFSVKNEKYSVSVCENSELNFPLISVLQNVWPTHALSKDSPLGYETLLYHEESAKTEWQNKNFKYNSRKHPKYEKY